MRIYSSVAIVFLADKVSADRRRRHHRLRHLNEDISMSMLTPMSPSLIEESSEVTTQEEEHHQSKSGKSMKAACNLADFRQWRGEVGYWLGELTLYQSDGTPFESTSWPYPYNQYRGFITGNIEGGSYRQRNVFLYPPQDLEVCAELDPNVKGDGTCGANGNSLVFAADQSAETCSDGTIGGIFAGGFDTKTELVGADNALLYQVFAPEIPFGGKLFQSQLTTLTGENDTIRTRSAQQFDALQLDPLTFVPLGIGLQETMSFFRERKVTEEEFYTAFNNTIEEYKILDSDLCSLTLGARPYLNYTASYEQCIDHLNQSFESPFNPI